MHPANISAISANLIISAFQIPGRSQATSSNGTSPSGCLPKQARDFEFENSTLFNSEGNHFLIISAVVGRNYVCDSKLCIDRDGRQFRSLWSPVSAAFVGCTMCTYHCIAVSIVGLSCHYANAVHYKPRCAHKLRCIISFLDPSEDTLSAKRQHRTAVIQPVHAPTQNAVCMHDSEPFEANLRCLDSKLRIPSLGFRGLPNCLNCKTFSGGLPAFASPGPFCSSFFWN